MTNYTQENSRIFGFSSIQNLLHYRKPLAQNLFDDRLAKNYDNAHNDIAIRQHTKYKKVKSRVQVADEYESSHG